MERTAQKQAAQPARGGIAPVFSAGGNIPYRSTAYIMAMVLIPSWFRRLKKRDHWAGILPGASGDGRV